MKTILSFDKPKKLRSTEDHNASCTSDSGVDGTYVPNMSREDMERWKGKKIGGADPRVEIRKTVRGREPGAEWPSYAQMLAIIRPNGLVVLSANGRMVFEGDVFQEFHQAVREARAALHG